MRKDSTEKDNLDSTNIDHEKVKEIFEIIRRGSEEILVEGELKKRLSFLYKRGNH